MARKRSRKEKRAIHAKKYRGNGFRNTRAPIGDDAGPLGGSGGLTEERSVTSDTAIGTGTALTYKQKAFIGGKHRVTNTKGDGDRIL